ncbi:hypothetical protein WMF20_10650 [Sorangium sp. So ce834]|uniref:hypothetical protein n=1 Tax=Sorangium sp. So ce834 TaxID=3133321 RepID=UPI003F627DB4
MKKFTILASLAVMSISGSAMAIAPGPHAITIEGAPSGTGTFMFVAPDGANPVLAPNGTCAYNLLWAPPASLAGFGTRICQVLEATTFTFPSCMGSLAVPGNITRNINSVMYAGDNFTPICNGFQGAVGGFPATPISNVIMILGESATGTPSAVGILQSLNFSFLGALSVVFT